MKDHENENKPIAPHPHADTGRETWSDVGHGSATKNGRRGASTLIYHGTIPAVSFFRSNRTTGISCRC